MKTLYLTLVAALIYPSVYVQAQPPEERALQGCDKISYKLNDPLIEITQGEDENDEVDS
jgi:hypothetical protein